MMAKLGFTINDYASAWARSSSFLPWLRMHLGVYLRNGTSSVAVNAKYDVGTTALGVELPHCPAPNRAAELHKAWRERQARSFTRKNCSAMEQMLPCQCMRQSNGVPLLAGAWSV